MESDRISTVQIVVGDKITHGARDGKIAAQFPAGTNCIEVSALRGEMTDVVRVGIRADNYPCFLCRIRVEGAEKDTFELSKDGLTWVNYIFYQFIYTTNQIFYIRSQTYDKEEFRDYIENHLQLEFKAPIGSSGSIT